MQRARVGSPIDGTAHRLAVDRDHHPFLRAGDPLGQRRDVAREARLERRGIEQPIHRETVSWRGMPPGSPSHRRNSASFERPTSAVSTRRWSGRIQHKKILQFSYDICHERHTRA